ncbi:hypothetical protein [Planktotalea sp.]|uniref:hypothetical protein n=1 Tax=Planktotalea sp. TaxID=2029877 RepID=UPI003F6BDB80
MITQADQSAQRKAEPQHQAEIIPIRPAQKSAPLDLSPYKVQPTSTIDDSKKEMPKALFAAQVEILISNDEKAPYEETEEISTLDKVPEPILSTRNAEELVNDAGANLSVLAKALALNAQTRDQKDRIYNSCLALLDEHGPDLLDSACNQALVAGTSSLSAVVSVIRKQTTDDTKFHPKPPVTIAHSNIRGAGYFN